MYKRVLFHVLSAFVFVASMQAQIPTWEGKIQLPIPSQVTAAFSDNYGQHILRQTVFDPITQSTGFNHFLFGNDGVMIASNSGKIVRTGGGDPPLFSTFSVSITGYNGILYVVAARRIPEVFQAQLIDLWQSTDGGATWIGQPTRSLVGLSTVTSMDAIADQNGLHVVWQDDAGTRVFYNRFDGVQWRPLSEVTLAGTAIARPKVVTIGNTAVVSLVNGTAGSMNRGTSRDYDIATETFEPSYRFTNAVSAGAVAQANLGVLNNEAHILLVPSSSSDRNLRYSKRTVGNEWEVLGTSSWFANGDEDFDYRRRVAATNGVLYVLYHSSAASVGRFFVADYTTQWTASPFEVANWPIEPPIGLYGAAGTVSASKTGLYVFWSQNLGSSVTKHFMRRRVVSIQGSISSNAFWTGNNWITGTLNIASNVSIRLKPGSVTRVLSGSQITVNSGVSFVVESGATLIFEPGTQMVFAPGTGITCYGQLNATSSTGSPVVFTSTSPSTSWNGIFLNGAGSNLTGVQISNALIGIKANENVGITVSGCTVDGGNYGVYLFSGTSEGVPTSTLIEKNVITHSSVAGIYVDVSSSHPIVRDNTLQGQLTSLVGNYGMIFMQSSPLSVTGNKMSSYGNAGIYCYNSSPSFVNGSAGGHNCSFNNYGTGVLAEQKAAPVFGDVANNNFPGFNTITNNQNYQMTLLESSEVLSQVNFYREPAPDPGLDFSIDGSSRLYFEPFQTTDPNACSGGGASVVRLGGGEGKEISDDPPTNSLLDPLLRQVIRLRLQRQHATAIIQLKSIVANAQSPVDAKVWAVHEMLANYAAMPRQTGNNRLSAYLRNLPQSQSNSEVKRAAGDALAVSLRSESDNPAALAALDENIRMFPNTPSKLTALFGKVSLALNALNDLDLAERALRAMQASSPRARLTKLAEKMIESAEQSVSGYTVSAKSMKQNKSTVANTRPILFELDQNFPNPFNPTTTIQYELPNDGNISLAVYDVLGREVAALESGLKTAGSYNATFDASKLASGVYIYRLQAGNTILSRRMVLVK